MPIRPLETTDVDAVVSFSVRAWAPVFQSLEEAMNPRVYRQFFPDWKVCQAKAVGDVCSSDDFHVWVWDEDDQPIGFVAVRLHADDKMGEIYMIAVEPTCQRRGIARELTDFAADWMKTQGMRIAMVETGGDPGHAPARATYERAGFELLPVARYFKPL